MNRIYENPLYKFLRKTFYQVLDALTKRRGVRVKVNGFSLRLPAHYYRMFPSDYEQDNFHFFKKVARRGMTCIDIGAHVGLYSVFMSKYGEGKVFAFEPTISSREILQKVVELNRCQQSITVVPAAVSEKNGKATFFVANAPLSMANSLVDIQFGDGDLWRSGYDVEVVSIDSFVEKKDLKVDFLKIDAEGVEVEVLKGAKDTFIKHRPSGTLGIHPFAYKNMLATMTEIWHLLETYNMEVFFDGKTITKENFLMKSEIFDVQFIPRGARVPE